MLVKFEKVTDGTSILLDSISGLTYSSEVHEAPIQEAKPAKDTKEHIEFDKDYLMLDTFDRFVQIGLEITEARRKNKKVFFHLMSYRDRVTKEYTLVAYDVCKCYICNDLGKTIDTI